MTDESPSSQHSGSWAVFNSGGACVIENVSREIAADYMTADRFERGWTMVSVVVFKSMADLASPPPQATGALSEERVHQILDAAFRQAALDGTWSPGRQQSMIAARAIERAHGIGSETKE